MQVLLVTGASRGIGAEIARLAAEKNYAVALNYARSREEADNVVAEIESKGGRAIALQADITDESQVKNMFQEIDGVLGPIDALVNNAGVNGSGTRVDELDTLVARRLFEVNILGSFLCAKHAIQRMAKRHGGNGGVIVNISSAASKHGGPFTYVDYAASKGALDTFTVGLAKEQADQGIRVNTVRPGATMTELSVDWAKKNPEWLKWVMKQVPLGRPAETREIANAVLFLLSEEATFITGTVLDANGGWVSP